MTKSRRAPLQRDHVAVGNDEQPILLRPLVHARACKAGEGRQYANARAKHEGGELRVLTTASVHRHARMQMTGEHVTVGVLLGFVNTEERANRIRRVDAPNTERRGWIAGVHIVIAAHQCDCHGIVRVAPGGDCGAGVRMPTRAGMQQVANLTAG